MDLKQAYAILEVPEDASTQSVEETYQDLREVWNPQRFINNGRLQKRAAQRLGLIEEAYRLVAEQIRPPESLLDLLNPKATGAMSRSSRVKKGNIPPPGTEDGASLLQAVFAEDSEKSGKRFPTWIIIGVVVALVVVVSLFVNWGGKGGGRSAPEEGGGSAATAGPVAPAPTAPIAAKPTSGAQTSQPASAGAGKQGGAAPLSVERPGRSNETPGAGATLQPPAEKTRQQGAQPLTASRDGVTQQSRPAQATRPESQLKPPTAQAPESARSDGKPKLVRGPDRSEEEGRKALEILRAKSEEARKLLEGESDRFRFVDWQTTPRGASQFWVEVVAEPKGAGQAMRFIWLVDSEKQIVTAMSQAARDLEIGRSRM